MNVSSVFAPLGRVTSLVLSMKKSRMSTSWIHRLSSELRMRPTKAPCGTGVGAALVGTCPDAAPADASSRTSEMAERPTSPPGWDTANVYDRTAARDGSGWIFRAVTSRPSDPALIIERHGPHLPRD